MLVSEDQLSQHVFVVFADDWGRHPSSCQHLFRRIITQAQVIWVNTIGHRMPRFTQYDIGRAAQILRTWIRPRVAPGGMPAGHSVLQSAHGLSGTLLEDAPLPHVLSPPMLPSCEGATTLALNQRLLSRAVHKALRHLAPDKHPILVSTSPTVPGLFRDPAFKRKVYYCVDDFTHWHGINGEAMRRLEQETLDACDLMIATSTAILETRSAFVGASTLLTHGVDLAHFSRAAPDRSSPLAALPHPLVGMFGVFDQRVDGQALKAAARLSPQATFVVLGPVVDRAPGEFRDVSNLHFLGNVPYADLPRHVFHFDLCVLPYVVDESTRNINPLKLKEYLATGKPVIASPLPEAVQLADYLTLATPEDFPRVVASALATLEAGPYKTPARLQPGLERFLQSESWEAKARRFLYHIMKGL